jgi:hypothetical protein
MQIFDPVYVGDIAEMRKPHPCGGVRWQVDRVGADIGMVCLTCKRRVLIPRRKFAHQVKRFIQRGAEGE